MTEPIVLAAIVAAFFAVGFILSISEGKSNGDWGGVGFLAAAGLILAALLATVTVTAIVAG